MNKPVETLITEFYGERPKIVVLCGSTRFVDEFNRQRKELTEQGQIVLSIEVVTTQAREDDPQHTDPALKARLDELHKRKIDLADEVFVLNVGGYIGESTKSEIDYAQGHGKLLRWLEQPLRDEDGALVVGARFDDSRVNVGATYLDAAYPDWIEHVDADRLDPTFKTSTVLGQVLLGMHPDMDFFALCTLIDETEAAMGADLMRQRGFTGPVGSDQDADAADLLHDSWRELIKMRRAYEAMSA